MSEEPATPDLVERTRRNFEAGASGEWEAVFDDYAPNAVWDNTRTMGEVFEGLAAIRGFVENWLAAYETHESEQEELLDLGGGVIFMVNVQKARLLGSTGDVRAREAWVAQWVDGLIVRVTVYTDIDEARAAAERLAQEAG